MFNILEIKFMKAYIIETIRKIAPFDRFASAIYSPMLNFGNLTKEELVISDLKVRFIKSVSEIDFRESFLLIPDYVFVTAGLIKKFIFISKNAPDIIKRLAVLKSTLTDYYTALMDYESDTIGDESVLKFDIFYVPANSSIMDYKDSEQLISYLRRSSQPIKITQNFGIRLRRLSNIKGRPFYEEFPITDEIVGHQRFWLHSLLLNILYISTFKERIANGYFTTRFINKPKTVNNNRVINSVIGSNVWLHPTSVVENSVLCDNVKVGAKTVIKDAVIMRDTNIGDSNIINLSLFGENVNTLSNSVFCCSVIAPSSTISNLGFYYSFLGKGSFVATAVIILWEGINSTIRISVDGEELDTSRYFLGSAIGDGSVLGARAIINPGIAIPKNSIIVLRPEEGVMKIPHMSETEQYVWENATLSRFEDIFPEYDKNNFF